MKMYKLTDFASPVVQSVETKSKFTDLLCQKWNEIHNQGDVFRYKIDKIQEKVIDGRYILLLNPDRNCKRRTPEEIVNIMQPFDKNKFNFTKASPKEIMLKLLDKDETHVILVNVSPISPYHSLLCPSLDRCLPQVITEDSILLVLKIMFVADRNLRVGFNSLCGLASVNHLHYHLLWERNEFPVEIATCKHLFKQVHYLSDYLIPAFCFEVLEHNISTIARESYNLISYLLKNSIAHNVLITRGTGISDHQREVVRLIIWPRKSSAGAKQMSAFNVAAYEMSGCFPVFSENDFEMLTRESLETELRKWKYNDFERLCDEIKQYI